MTARRLPGAVRASCGAICIGVLAAACGNETPPPLPPSFQRPNRVAFMCVSAAREVVVDLDCCRPCPAACLGETTDAKRSACCLAARPSWCRAADYDLHALVTQSGRGEVAAVNLDEAQVVDSRRDVPGYTFVPVGELPSAIIIPSRHSELTYVANYGSRDLYVLRSQAFLSLPPGEDPVLQVVPIGDRDSAASPVDAALSPDEDALYLAVPGLGGVLRMPLRRCEAGAPACQDGLVVEDQVQFIDLAASRARAPGTAPASVVATGYERLCDFPRPTVALAPPPARSEAALAVASRPIAFAIDAFCRAGRTCDRRVLVADEALPLIHVLDLDAFADGASSVDAVREPIFVGVPTTAVAVTPRVPLTLAADDARETQYVYAVDATDGSVIALQDGHVLTVDADSEGRPDRVPLRSGRGGGGGPAVAAALAVMTPGFDTTGPAAQYVKRASAGDLGCDGDSPKTDDALCVDCEHQQEDPRRLRGVFLAVALTDGTVRVVDVHDMELDRGPGSSCRKCPAGPIPVLVRHHPRLAVNFQSDAPDYQPDMTPELTSINAVVEGRGFIVRSDGTTNSPDVPGLDCFDCTGLTDAGYVHVFPTRDEVGPDGGVDAGSIALDAGADGGDARAFVGDTGLDAALEASIAAGDASVDGGVAGFDRCPDDAPSLLCAITDPWFASEEAWRITYEGVIPGAASGVGRFVAASSAENRSGGLELVASDVDLCAAGVEDGDQVAVTSRVVSDRLLPDAGLDECAKLEQAVEEDPDTPVLLPIVRVFADRLGLGRHVVRPIAGHSFTTDDVATCTAGAPVTFVARVRSRDVDGEAGLEDGYAVVGSRSGFLHSVARDASGRCIVPKAADPLRTGRAYAGMPFRNGRIAFLLRRAEPGAAPRLGAEVDLSLETPARKLVFDARSLTFGSTFVVPAELRYSDIDRRLYLIDINRRGLVPIPLDPFPDRSTFGFE